MSRFVLLVVLGAFVSNLGWAEEDPAQDPSGWKMVDVPLTSDSGEGVNEYFEAPSIITSLDNGASGDLQIQVSAELLDLARGLGNDPLRIYNYVRNEIESQLYFGLKKGPLTTYHEASGNDLDKSFLLATLLKAAKFNGNSNINSITFVSGWQNLAYYSGSNADPDICSLWRISENAMPDERYLNYLPSGASDTNAKRLSFAMTIAVNSGYCNDKRIKLTADKISLRRFWVRMNNQDLDPWPVVRRQVGKTNLLDDWTANSQEWVGGNVTNNFVWKGTGSSYVNKTYKNLADRSKEVLSIVKSPSNLGNLTVAKILGSYRTIKVDYSVLPPVNVASVEGASPTLSTKLAYSLEFTLGGDPAVWKIHTPLLNEKRMWVEYDGSSMKLMTQGEDGSNDVSRLSLPNPPTSVKLSVTYKLPMMIEGGNTPILKQEVMLTRGANTTAKQSATYHTLFYGYTPKKGTIRARQEYLDLLLHRAERLYPGAVSSEQGIVWSNISDQNLRKSIVLEILNIRGLAWLEQTAITHKVIGDVFNANMERSISLGRMSQDGGFFVDAFFQYACVSSREGKYRGKGGEVAAWHATSLFESALEHSLIEQSSQDGRPGISTVSILSQTGMANGWPLGVLVKDNLPPANSNYWATQEGVFSSSSVANSQINSYQEKLTNVEARMDGMSDGLKIPAIILRSSPGGGSYLTGPNAVMKRHPGEALLSKFHNRMSVGFSQGGYNTSGEMLDPQYITRITQAQEDYQMSRFIQSIMPEPKSIMASAYGADPVNLLNGSFDYAETDFRTGDGVAPRNMSLERYYSSSSAHSSKVGMAFGWTHNWNIYVTESTTAELAMGEGSARHMVPFYTALNTLKENLLPPDYLRDGNQNILKGATNKPLIDTATTDPRRWLMYVSISKWAADQLTSNAIVATLGNDSETFMRMPDGTFEAGGASSSELTLDSSSKKFTLKQKAGNSILFNSLNATYSYNRGRAIEMVGPDGQKVNFIWNSKGLSYVKSTVGAKTRRIDFAYDGSRSNLMTRATLSDGDQSLAVEYAYDAFGNLTSSTDSENLNPTQVGYSNSNKKTKYYYLDETLPGEATPPVFDFNKEIKRSRMYKLVNPEEQTVALNDFDSLGRVSKQYQNGDLNSIWSFLYNGICNIEIDPYGHSKQYGYDERGHLWCEIDALGKAITREYDDEGRVVKSTDPAGGWTETKFDVNHNPVETKRYANANQVTPWMTSANFDGLNRPLSLTDELGRTTSFTYFDNLSRSAKTITLAGKTTTYTLAPSGWAKGLPATITDRDGYSTIYTYTPEGWVSTIAERGAPVKQFKDYNIFGSPETTIDENGYTDTAKYNNRGQVVEAKRVDPANSSYSRSGNTYYDGCGRIAREEFDTGRAGGKKITAHTYSPTDKKLTSTHAGGDGVLGTSDDMMESSEYDARDLLKSETDVHGNSTIHHYNADGSEQRADLPADPAHGARSQSYQYDVLGRVEHASDVMGRGTSTSYEDYKEFTLAAGGLVRGTASVVTDPMNFQIKNFSDAAGRLRKMYDRREKPYEFSYDVHDHQTEIRTPDGKVFTKTYTAEGRVLTDKQNSAQPISYGYDPVTGRVSTTTYPDAVVQNVEFDGKGQLKRSIEGSDEIKRTYDAFDRVKTYTNPQGWTIGYEYYNDGLLKKIYYPEKDLNPFDNPFTVTYEYDQAGRLKKLTDWSNRNIYYNWRTDGKLESVTRFNGTSRKMLYDAVDRVSGFEERSSYEGLLTFNRFNYRKNDDLQGRFNYPTLPANQTLTPVTATEYTSDNALSSINGVTCGHDSRGNMTKGPLSLQAPVSIKDLVFDWRNRLTGIGSDVTYSYDHEGNRKRMERSTLGSEYVFDPHGGALTRMLMRKDSNGVVVRCVYGLGLEYEEEITAPASAPKVRVLHPDHTASIVAITDGVGAVLGRQTYDPYGRIIHSSGIWDTAFGYAGFLGVMTDPDGLIWMRARFYSPVLGRFISMDPARFEGGMNWYAYAGGNPLRFADPTGLGPQNTLDLIQDGLSLLGMLPVIGPAFDLVNAGISIARGNYGDAAMHIFSALPGIGDIAAAGALSFKMGARLASAEMRLGGGIASETMQSMGSLRCTAPLPWKGGSGLCFVAGTPVTTAEGLTAIETLQVGDRVLTTSGQYSATEVDPQAWRKITVSLSNPDLQDGSVEMELLRSERWMTDAGCRTGARIWMEIGEMGLYGWANVQRVDACPPIQAGTGRVVLATMTRPSAQVVNVAFAGAAGGLTGTPGHPLYSLSRGEWASLAELEPGEVLATRDGQVTVGSLSYDPEPQRVFNLEIESDHCYFVGNVGVLGHNACPVNKTVQGSFSITELGWKGYPVNPKVPRPVGPFRLLQGAEKSASRSAANNANRAAHRADSSLAGQQIHEIQPVKFGGSATDSANKVPLTPQEHAPFTSWWRQLQRDIEGR